MRPKRFREYTEKLKDIFKEDVDKFDNFIDFKKSIILTKSGSEKNLYAPKLNDKYSNLQFSDKDLKDWWDIISRSVEDLSRFLFNIYHELKGLPQRTKTDWNQKYDSVTKYKCQINSLNDIRISKSYKQSPTVPITYYNIFLPKECMDIFKNQKFAIDKHGDKRNIIVEIEDKENRIHFPKGIAQELRGNNLGHWIYLAMIKKLGYITSNSYNTSAIKQVYYDLISLPKWENDIMTLILQYDILIFDKQTKLDVKKIFREFIFNKFTEKDSVKCSPALKEILGDEFTNWHDTLTQNQSKESIERKIKNFESEIPEYGDIVYDTELKIIYKSNGVWKENKRGELISLRKDFEMKTVPFDSKRYKVITKNINF